MDLRQVIESTLQISRDACYEINGERVAFDNPEALSDALIYDSFYIKK